MSAGEAGRCVSGAVSVLSRCVARGFVSHDVPFLAASVAYYALLSVFPLALLASAVAAAFLGQAEVQAALRQAFAVYLPPDAASVVERAVLEAVRAHGQAGAAALAVFLWSGSAATGAMRHALNRIFRAAATPPLWRRKLLEMAATLVLAGLLGASVSLAVARAVFVRLAPQLGPEVLRLFPGLDPLGKVGPPFLAFLTFLVAYRLLPARRLPWGALTAGAACAAVLFELVRALVFFGVEKFVRYQVVYGSLAGMVVLSTWVYVAALVVLVGAEVARCRADAAFLGAPDGIRTRVAGLKDRSPRPG